MPQVTSAEKAPRPAFIGPKCRNPIPSTCEVPVDALIQASLDPGVIALGHVAAVHWHGHALRLDGAVVTTAAGSFLLNVTGSRLRDLDEVGTTLLALEQAGIGFVDVAASSVMREPRRTDFRTVWGCRHVPVSEPARRVVSEELERRPFWSLGDLLNRLDIASPLETVYALACQDRLCLDLTSARLSLDTPVGARHGVGRPASLRFGGRGMS